MEKAIRWSTHSTSLDRQFLYVDVTGRSIRLCRVTSSSLTKLTYETVATHTRVPAFRAFDWSPANPALVAVGQSSGEATVVRIDDGSEAAISFPIRSQRLCNAVALNTQGLLAAGLDKVRNDFCLNIWDLNQRVPSIAGPGTYGFSSDKGHVDPYAKLASSEPITSIKFFVDQPQTLVAGVKAQFVRLYDLREPHGSATLQFATRCVHNLAIDPCDENYIASCMPTNDPTISVWDRRVGSRSHLQGSSFSSSDSNSSGPLLELKSIADAQGSIWSLRFAKSRRGCLGMLTSTGQFKTFEFGKEYITEADRREREQNWGPGWNEYQPDEIFVERIQEIEPPYHVARAARKENKRMVSFDFISNDDDDDELAGAGLISIADDGDIRVSGTGHPKLASSFSQFTATPRFYISNQSKEPDSDLPPPISLHDKNVKPSQAHPKRARFSKFPDSMRLFRERCAKGYRFDASKNKAILGRDSNLSTFWRLVQHFTTLARSSTLSDDQLDFSFLGVHSIWMDEVGIPSPYTTRRIDPSTHPPPNPSKTTQSLAAALRLLALTPSPQTSYLDHRRLCLFISGQQRSPTNLENKVDKLSRRNQPTKAAAFALFASQPKMAIQALRKSSSESHKMLAMAIASSRSRLKRTRRSEGGSSSGEDSENEWEKTLTSLLGSIPPAHEDPYAHAIVLTIRHGTPAHSSIIENSEVPLPLRDRVSIAIHHLPDEELTTFISKLTKSCISQGDLEGILLTGLATPGALSLFSNYISRTGDVQTAILALTPVIPRYLSDPTTSRLFESWREEYRTQMQIWDLKFQRVKFDVTGRKLAVSRTGVPLIPPAKTQVSINCTYCQQSVTQFPAPAKPGYSAQDSTTDDANDTEGGLAVTAGNVSKPGPVPTTITSRRTPRSNPLASAKAAAVGTICPKCGRSLPRCGICELPLGMPDPTYIKPLHTNHLVQSSRSTLKTGVATNGTENATDPSKRGSILSTATAKPIASSSTVKPSQPEERSEEKPTPQPEVDGNQPNGNWDEVMSKFITFCVSCGHGFHAKHAREWFSIAGHKVCPVADCPCPCDRR